MQSKSCVVDTNIIVRFIIDEDAYLLGLLEEYDNIHIPIPIIFECAYVLEKIYKLERLVITDYLLTLISYTQIITEKEIIKNTFNVYVTNHKLSPIDCYLLTFANKKAVKIESYDKSLVKQQGEILQFKPKNTHD